ncbi:M15 family metallopeptidase [Streptomyces sp. NPDC048659]|uniref:M15 family metallopeptidase n=1 Tax=Streptomyces sp. NPDC048659 TaxID=3155489 RepID=UPI0034318681
MTHPIDRRRVLAAGAALGAATALAPALTGTAHAAPAPRAAAWTGKRTANGWPVLEQAQEFTVEGSGRRVRLAAGPAAVLLLHVARRFHYEIAELRADDLDGHTRNRTVGQRYESNHLSGTALAIRPAAYPTGVKDGLYPRELVVVRDILAELEGTVAWGGDFRTPKESHFQLAHGPGDRRLTAVAARIEGWNAGPGGVGAGATDAFAPERRARARAFARS